MVKFIADGMHGRLTRWLRMLGEDVQYFGSMQDDKLLITAKKENRILITSDFQLYQRSISNGIPAFYMGARKGAEKLATLSRRYGVPLTIDLEKSRCPKCNSKIKLIPKKMVATKVEKGTFNNYHVFWKCNHCGKIYWQGSHWTGICATLKEAKRISSSLKSS